MSLLTKYRDNLLLGLWALGYACMLRVFNLLKRAETSRSH
jgi:hypothetical protein